MIKYSIAKILLFFLSTPLVAQVIYERTYPFKSNSIEYPVELSDTSTFSFDNDNNCGGIGVHHIDKYGNELTENGFGAEGFSSGYHWIGHDSVLIWAVEGAWDAGVDSFRAYVWTPDTTNKILSKYMSSESRDVTGGAFLYSSHRLVYRQSDTLYSINLDNAVEEDSLVIPDIYSVIEFEKSILVLSNTSYPVLLNDRLDVIGIWADLSFLPFQINDELVLDSFLLGMDLSNPLSLATFNVYIEEQTSIDMSLYFDQVDEIQSNKNNLFVKGKLAGEEMILQLDSTFSFVDINLLNVPELDKEFTFQYYPERVYAWSTDDVANYGANYRMCYLYTTPTPIQYLDLALDTIWIDSVSAPSPHDHFISIYLKAVVSNHSGDIIQNFTMHHEEIPAHFCDDGIYVRSFDERKIEPNASDTIRFQLWTYQYGMYFNRRVYVHHANHHLDSIMLNNSFLVNHLLSNSEVVVDAHQVVYPNPFTDFISISDGNELSQLVLYDQTGRIVAQGIGQLNDLEKLPTSYYVLQAIDATTNRVSRVVKVE